MELNLATDYRLIETSADEKTSSRVKTGDLGLNCNGWFYHHLSRPLAEQMLLKRNRPLGSFVVRCSQTKHGYALSVKLEERRIGHFLIGVNDKTGSVSIWKMNFQSITNLVKYFTKRPIHENILLVLRENKKPKIARLVFETFSKNQWELSLRYNEYVQILTKIDKEWLVVQNTNSRIGLVPSNHVEIIQT